MPITMTDLALWCCSAACTSGVIIENNVFSTVPTWYGPRLARSISGTVLPKAVIAFRAVS